MLAVLRKIKISPKQFFKLGMMGALMAIAGVIICTVYSGRVAVVLAIAVPVMLAIMIALLVLASRYSTKLRTYIDKLNELFLEAIEGVRVIRAFNKQQHEIDRFDVTNSESSVASRRSIALSCAMYPVATTVAGISSIAAAAVGTPLVIFGQMENGDIKEVGDHDTLMSKGGKYAELYNSQFA